MDFLERRKEARYICYGQVRMNRIPGVARSGRIVDLSRGGCLIEMRLPIYVSQGTAVELSVQTKGIALRMQGKVAFVDRTRPGQIGISFERLTERGQAQLSELVAEFGMNPARNRNGLAVRKRRIW
jgi:hypothetical protein